MYSPARPIAYFSDEHVHDADWIPFGMTPGTDATFEDITVLKEAQDKLQKSHDRIEAIYGALDDAIILVDPITRKVIECNSATAKIFGYTYEEMLGKDTRSLHIDQEHFEKFGREAIAAYADPGYYVTEFEMRRKDGRVFPTENFVRPVLDSNAQIVYVVSVVRDITDRKRLHAQLSQLQKAFYVSYVVFELDHENYQYAFVSGPSTKYLWLLSRTPSVEIEIIEKFIEMSNSRGFDTDNLIFVQHN